MNRHSEKLVLDSGRISIDEKMVRAHVMKPRKVAEARSDRGRPLLRVAAEGARPRPRTLTHLSVINFEYGIQEALGGACVGYSFQLRQQGAIVAQQNYQFAQLAVGAGVNTPWAFSTSMHIASLSKVITAMAMTQLLNRLGVSTTSSISSYLPTYWAQGQNVSEITFDNLMTHKSGLTSGATDYESMKSAIYTGVTSVGTYAYSNMNFSLCRILYTVLNNILPANFDPFSFLGTWFSADLLDPLWDLVAVLAFSQYVQQNIFVPSNAQGHLVHQPPDALGYDFPTSSNEVGLNDGDLSTGIGADGWHMSVNDLLNIMGTFRRAGTIMSVSQAQTMLDDSYGIDWVTPTTAGTYYGKNGAWSWNGQEEQGVAFFFPEDMEFVLLVNSPVGGPESVQFLAQLVANVYIANLG